MYKNCDLKIFALSASKDFGKEICKSRELKHPEKKCIDLHFDDGESYARPDEDVRDKDVFVIQSLHSVDGEAVDTKVMRLAIFNNATKYASAARITNVIPYLAYTRQDRKDKSRAPLSAQVIADLFMNSGANRILGMDWHNPAVHNAYRIPVDILDPISEFVQYLIGTHTNQEKIVALAPDAGAAERNDRLAQKLTFFLKRDVGFAVVLKERKSDDVKFKDIVGDVDGAITLTYDDESVTGSTLVGSAEMAQKKGARASIALITHAKFTEDGVKRLEDSCLERILITDTIWRPGSFYEKHPKFEKVSVTSLFAEAIRRIHNSESISTLFELVEK